MLNRSGESIYPYPVPDLRGKGFDLSPLRMMKEPWPVWLTWLECRSVHQKVTGSIPS